MATSPVCFNVCYEDLDSICGFKTGLYSRILFFRECWLFWLGCIRLPDRPIRYVCASKIVDRRILWSDFEPLKLRKVSVGWRQYYDRHSSYLICIHWRASLNFCFKCFLGQYCVFFFQIACCSVGIKLPYTYILHPSEIPAFPDPLNTRCWWEENVCTFGPSFVVPAVIFNVFSIPARLGLSRFWLSVIGGYRGLW